MILVVRGDREFLCEPGEEVHTDLGVLEVPADADPGDRLSTHLGEEFEVRALRGPDIFAHLQRTGAPMMPRDVGLVMGLTGVATGDRVLDAGTGTGVLAAYLARAGAIVVTYERDPDFADVARENMALAGVEDAVEVRTGDLTDHLDSLAERAGDPAKHADDLDDGHDDPADGHADPAGFDVLTLDTEDAAAVVARAPDLLVAGGFVAVYSPFVESSRAVVEAARDAGLSEIETLDTVQRRMDFDERGTRPSTAGVGHTGYLTIARN